jgi:hypothetical protein
MVEAVTECEDGSCELKPESHIEAHAHGDAHVHTHGDESCEMKTVEGTDANGNPITTEIASCDMDDQVSCATGGCTDVEGGHVCPLCGAAPKYQQLLWELEKYKKLLAQSEAKNAALTADAEDTEKKEVPKVKEITIC